MSGATLAAGDTIEKEHEDLSYEKGSPARKKQGPMSYLIKPLNTPLTLIHTQLICFSAVLVASGAVPIPTLLFPVLASVYIVFMAVLVFSPVDRKHSPARLFEGDKWFQVYTIFETIVALILPVGKLSHKYAVYASGKASFASCMSPRFLQSTAVDLFKIL
jgi:hypothetical protein